MHDAAGTRQQDTNTEKSDLTPWRYEQHVLTKNLASPVHLLIGATTGSTG